MAAIPAVTLDYVSNDPDHPSGPAFAISEDCIMPKITVTATLKDVVPNPAVPLQFEWKVTLVFNGSGCLHSLGLVIAHPEISQVTSSNSFTIPFSAVRGGDLTISVSVSLGSSRLTAISQNLKVVGTNPTVGKLSVETTGSTDAFKKLMRLESGLRQFRTPACPLFSSDNAGGVGLCQLTSPAPSEDQVWSWRENLKGGMKLYNEKQAIAAKYPAKMQVSSPFKTLVRAFNRSWTASSAVPSRRYSESEVRSKTKEMRGKSALTSSSQIRAWAPKSELIITLPPYTDEQLARDTLRGFNGWAGGLHEYRPKVDQNGLLAVTVGRSGTTGTAEWELVTKKERTAYYDMIGLDDNRRGDPDYVDDVLKQARY